MKSHDLVWPNTYTIILVLAVALLTLVGWAFTRDYTSNQYMEDWSSKYPLIDPSRSFIEQSDFIVNIQPLRETLIKYVEENDLQDSLTLYFEVLNTGANMNINQDFRVYPASLLKVPTAMAAMKKVELGEWQLHNKLVLMEQDVDSNYGQHYKDVIGQTYTIEELIKFAIVESDNTANKILVRNLSIDEIADVLDAMGLIELLDEDRRITVREYSRIFRTLRYSSFLNTEHSQQILDWLTQSNFNDYIEAGIPPDIKFAHKIGEDDQTLTYLDAGIVYAENRPYLLTIAITEKEKNEAKKIMEEISRLTYEYVSTY